MDVSADKRYELALNLVEIAYHSLKFSDIKLRLGEFLTTIKKSESPYDYPFYEMADVLVLLHEVSKDKCEQDVINSIKYLCLGMRGSKNDYSNLAAFTALTALTLNQ